MLNSSDQYSDSEDHRTPLGYNNTPPSFGSGIPRFKRGTATQNNKRQVFTPNVPSQNSTPIMTKTARPYRSPMESGKESPDPLGYITLENKNLHDRVRILKD